MGRREPANPSNRRFVAGAASLVAVVVVTAGVLLPLRPDPRPPTPTPPSIGPAVDTVPPTLPWRLVPQLPADGLPLRPVALPLSQRPATRAVAVTEPAHAENATRPEPLYVLDTGGAWSRIDVVDLDFTRDDGGNRAVPLRPTAISPDRRLVAVPQTDEVLVIDVTTAQVHRVPLPGHNEQVMWLSDGVVLVTHDADERSTRTYAVDWRAKTATEVGAGLSVWNTVQARPGGPVLELRGPASAETGNEPVTVTEWNLDRQAPLRQTPVDSTALGPYRVDEWYGPAFRNGGDLVVRSGWGRSPTVDGTEFVVVTDVRTGQVRRMLDLGRDRWKMCCVPLDWVDDHTVLLHAQLDGLVVWDVRSGAVSTAGPGLIGGSVAVALE